MLRIFGLFTIMAATFLQISTALALAASTATALQFWATVGEIPMTVPLRFRMPLTRNITCDVDDLISLSRVPSGEVADGLVWAQEMLCLQDGYVLTLGTVN